MKQCYVKYTLSHKATLFEQFPLLILYQHLTIWLTYTLPVEHISHMKELSAWEAQNVYHTILFCMFHSFHTRILKCFPLVQFDASTQLQLTDNLWTVWQEVVTLWSYCFSFHTCIAQNVMQFCGTCVICSLNGHRFNGVHCGKLCHCKFDNMKCPV
jgi:hypothetical protein